MSYKRFEELPVWQASIELALATYAMTAHPAFRRQHSLRDQLERAALSVSNNVAEGFKRGTNQELITFLYIARGSAGETRSMLRLLERMPGFRDLETGISNLKSSAESISRQLGAWIRTLRDADLKGQRYVTEKTRRMDQARREREEFLKKLEQIRKAGSTGTGGTGAGGLGTGSSGTGSSGTGGSGTGGSGTGSPVTGGPETEKT
jgi:four helix bundle protein